MLNKIAPLAVLVALGLGSAASAATDTGTIQNVDIVNDTVTLTDGTTFSFDDDGYADRLNSFKAGDAVAVSYHHVGTSLEATSISPVSAGYAGPANAPAAPNFSGSASTAYPDHGFDRLD